MTRKQYLQKCKKRRDAIKAWYKRNGSVQDTAQAFAISRQYVWRVINDRTK